MPLGVGATMIEKEKKLLTDNDPMQPKIIRVLGKRTLSVTGNSRQAAIRVRYQAPRLPAAGFCKRMVFERIF